MSNVFGKAVTNAVLKGMQMYSDSGKSSFTVLEKAQAAFEMKNADNKNQAAAEFLKNLRAKDNVDGVQCMIYNATGSTVTFLHSWDWDGKIGSVYYPRAIDNGQWGAFFHAQLGDAKGSTGAVAYTGKFDDTGKTGEWVFGWRSYGDDKLNKCFTEVHEDVFYGKKDYDTVALELFRQGIWRGKAIHRSNGKIIEASDRIGNTRSPVFVGIMSLVN